MPGSWPWVCWRFRFILHCPAQIGQSLEQSPISRLPRRLTRSGSRFIYLVSDGEHIIALDPLYRAAGGYIVRWYVPDQVFIDPSTGAWFNIYGEPARWAERSLERYPVRIDDGEVWVDLSK